MEGIHVELYRHVHTIVCTACGTVKQRDGVVQGLHIAYLLERMRSDNESYGTASTIILSRRHNQYKV